MISRLTVDRGRFNVSESRQLMVEVFVRHNIAGAHPVLTLPTRIRPPGTHPSRVFDSTGNFAPSRCCSTHIKSTIAKVAVADDQRHVRRSIVGRRLDALEWEKRWRRA